MNSTVVDVAHGYLLIGSAPEIAAAGNLVGDPSAFCSSAEQIVRLQVGTHTGRVSVTYWHANEGAPPSARAGAATGSAVIAPSESRIYLSTFHGMSSDFELVLPSAWQELEVAAVSDHYSRFSAGEKSARGNDGDASDLRITSFSGRKITGSNGSPRD